MLPRQLGHSYQCTSSTTSSEEQLPHRQLGMSGNYFAVNKIKNFLLGSYELTHEHEQANPPLFLMFCFTKTLTPCMQPHPLIPRGGLPYKNDRGAHQKISKNTLKGTRILFDRHGSNIFLPLRGTNFIQLKTYSVIFFQLIIHTLKGTVSDNSSSGYFRFQQPKWCQSTNFDPQKVW